MQEEVLPVASAAAAAAAAAAMPKEIAPKNKSTTEVTPEAPEALAATLATPTAAEALAAADEVESTRRPSPKSSTRPAQSGAHKKSTKGKKAPLASPPPLSSWVNSSSRWVGNITRTHSAFLVVSVFLGGVLGNGAFATAEHGQLLPFSILSSLEEYASAAALRHHPVSPADTAHACSFYRYLGATWLWWCSLSLVSTIHLGLVMRLAASLDFNKLPAASRLVVRCTIVFAIGAVIRTVIPVRWGTRPHACLFDVPFDGNFFGSDLMDRLTANAAELSMGALVAQSTALVHASLGHHRLASASRVLFWPIAAAQLACWYGCATDIKLLHVIEESLWGSTFAAHALLAACGWLLAVCEGVGRSLQCGIHLAVLLLSSLYVVFMFGVDVPMYYEQWRNDEANHVEYEGFVAGLQRMAACKEVSDNWSLWKEDVVWMSGYFGIAPLATLALATIATHKQVIGKNVKHSTTKSDSPRGSM